MGSHLTVEPCSRCRLDAVIHQAYSGQHLCGKHLASSVRKRTSRELRLQLELPKDARHEDGSPYRILVAVSGGKDSAVLLVLLHDIIGRRRDVELIAGCIDEGIDGYRAPSLECAGELAGRLGVRFETLSYEDMEFGRMDEVVGKMPAMGERHDEAKGLMPCSYCGVFRRQSINALAQRVGADVIALGHNLDDMAQSILMNLQKGEIDRSVRLAPHTRSPIDGIAPRIVPLRWIPEQEIHAHAVQSGLPIHHGECPHAPGAMRQKSRSVVARIESQTPGARHGLLHSIDQVRDLHQKAYPEAKNEVNRCAECGEITSKDVCQACTMRQWLAEAS
ncbi:MAG: TIGR00269 family protein [Candidatus Thalassarchaeaceae archaeon]|nr:TIGR00269 family protein [Candidatus Thalassarchaeaceae archaeon]MDP7003594.1 TIGR00269 family protein [Candidatus Thalassarchaeaceae archaeon]